MDSSILLHQGYKKLLLEIQQAKQQKKQHHSWLITGPKGVGKRTLCYEIAKLFLGDAPSFMALKEGDYSALTHQIAAKSHPDYIQLPSPSTVQDVRHLNIRCRQTRLVSAWRVVLIPEADTLGTHAVNALLKIIEEAPLQTVFLLTAKGDVPKTVASRCTRLLMTPLKKDRFDTLAAEFVPASIRQNPLFQIICQGCVGRAYGFKDELPLIQQTWDIFSLCRRQAILLPKEWQEQTEEKCEVIQEIFFLWCHHQALEDAFVQGWFLRLMDVWELGQRLFQEYRNFHTEWRSVLYALCARITEMLPHL